MTQPKHTPGPWKLEWRKTDGNRYNWHACIGENTNPVQCTIRGHYDNPELQSRQEANAHLIVAAPELLEALESAMGMIKGHQESKEKVARYEFARAAVAKAKGE